MFFYILIGKDKVLVLLLDGKFEMHNQNAVRILLVYSIERPLQTIVSNKLVPNQIKHTFLLIITFWIASEHPQYSKPNPPLLFKQFNFYISNFKWVALC